MNRVLWSGPPKQQLAGCNGVPDRHLYRDNLPGHRRRKTAGDLPYISFGESGLFHQFDLAGRPMDQPAIALGGYGKRQTTAIEYQ